MFKALVKKQLMEVNTWLLGNKKTGKRRSAAGVLLAALLYALCLVSFGMIFFMMAQLLCAPLTAAGLDWLYFSLMALVTLLLGLFGSIFTTYASLYQARDNGLLLSLPIPPLAILAVRLFGVWFGGCIFAATVFIPTLIAYWLAVPVSAGAVLGGIWLFLLLTVLVLSLSCLLGWVVAKLSGKLKNKTFATVALSLLFLALYYYGYFKASAALEELLAHADAIGSGIKAYIYPLYWLGGTGMGDPLSVFLSSLLILLLFALVVLVLSRNFIKMATAVGGGSKVRFHWKDKKRRSPLHALFFKETKRLTSSAGYMLNCGMGIFLMPIIGIVGLVKGPMLREVLASLMPGTDFRVLTVVSALCLISAMIDLTAPSVSLEGKNLWLVQALPVTPWQVLKAKLMLHSAVAIPPTLFCAVCMAIAMRLGPLDTLLALLLPVLFVLLCGCFGLFLNLKAPNLHWTNELVPIKQSMSVAFALFGSMVPPILLEVLYFAVCDFMAPAGYLALWILLIAALSLLLLRWLKKRGSTILATLG